MSSRYLVSGECPDCRAATAGESRCPHCGLVQVGPVAADLRATLHRADRILQVLREMPAPVPAPASPEPPPPDRRRGLPSVSVPLVLLGLGTLCVLVASFVFVAVTWTDLSLAWRTTILLAVTALAVVAATWVVRRGLRGAAEALTLVAAGLLLIDLLAGNSAGLPLLSWLSGTAFDWVVAACMGAWGLAWAVWARHTPVRALLGAQAVAALALLQAARLAGVGWALPYEWLAALVTVVAAALGLLLWPLRVPVVVAAAGLLAMVSWSVLALLGLVRAVTAADAQALFVERDAAPLLVASALAAVPALVRRTPSALRAVAAVAAVAGVVVVALLPVRDLDVTLGLLVVAAAGAVLVGSAHLVSGPWGPALRLSGAGATVLPGYMLVEGAAIALARAAATAERYWTRGIADPLGPLEEAFAPQLWGLVPLGAVVAAAAAAAWTAQMRLVAGWGLGGAVAGSLTAALLSPWPLLAVELAVAAATAVAVALAATTRHRGTWLLASAGLALVGIIVALPSVVATAVFFAAYAVLVLAVTPLVREARPALVTAGALLLGVTVQAVGELAGVSAEARGLWLVLFASALVLAGQALARRVVAAPWRTGLEAGGVLLGVAGLLQTGWDDLALSVGLTVSGVAAVVVSLVSADRRRVGWLGSGLLVLASWVRLTGLEVDLVEAYTLPGSLALLVAGLVWMRRTPSASSWRGLAPPLTLGVGPSLVVALEEPTSLRALLVGLVGLGLVGAAVRLRWGAPLLVGGTAVGLLALANLAPYAAGLPRWILFGAAGVTLLVLGVTWEQRRRDLSLARGYAVRLR